MGQALIEIKIFFFFLMDSDLDFGHAAGTRVADGVDADSEVQTEGLEL
jgi:hypothetical protein